MASSSFSKDCNCKNMNFTTFQNKSKSYSGNYMEINTNSNNVVIPYKKSPFGQHQPKPIHTFDASDAVLMPNDAPKTGATAETSASLLTITMLKFICEHWEKNPQAANEKFQQLTNMLIQNRMIPKEFLGPQGYELRKNLLKYIYEIFPSNPPRPILFSKPNQHRYSSEFEEICRLGKGGYASVYKAQNKLDGIPYAIKKIKVSNYSEPVEKVLKEVKMLASLNHPNIVRYYSAWIEEINEQPKSSSKIKELDGTSDYSEASEQSDSEVDQNGISEKTFNQKESFSNSNDQIISSGLSLCAVKESPDHESSRSLESSSSSSGGVIFAITSNGDHAQLDGVVSSDVRGIPEDNLRDHSLGNNHNNDLYSSRPKQKYRSILYIQIELCKESLKKWLDSRNSTTCPVVKDMENRKIFLGILKGVHCIHKENLIHRDLKPDNIFLNDTLEPKIGDFGLATTNEEDKLNLSGIGRRTLLSEGVGTYSYCSPEQRTSSDYDSKSDIFSLGLILYEMYHPSQTEMERADLFQKLRKERKLSDFILEYFPHKAEMVLNMTDLEPWKRPTAKDLLEREQPRSKDEIIQEQEKEIARLKAELEKERNSKS